MKKYLVSTLISVLIILVVVSSVNADTIVFDAPLEGQTFTPGNILSKWRAARGCWFWHDIEIATNPSLINGKFYPWAIVDSYKGISAHKIIGSDGQEQLQAEYLSKYLADGTYYVHVTSPAQYYNGMVIVYACETAVRSFVIKTPPPPPMPKVKVRVAKSFHKKICSKDKKYHAKHCKGKGKAKAHKKRCTKIIEK